MNLVRKFGTMEALARVSISIRKGEFFSLLGPSGCGKTTLLRLIAGLDTPDEGSLWIGNKDMNGVPPHKRHVNTVFQSYALFPHMTVRRNIEFGLRMKKIQAGEMNSRVNKVMDLVQIAPMSERLPGQLSGGQKQRVALARALVNEPEVLLLDEPLGALDLKLRRELQVELQQLQRRLGITFIFVTHDQEEALSMSHRIAVMNAGRIEQLDCAENLYEHPRTRFVANFLGSCNVIEAAVKSCNASVLEAESALGQLQAELPDGSRKPSPGDKVSLAIRPEKVALLPQSESAGTNCVEATLDNLVYCGAETQYFLHAGNVALKVQYLNTQRGHETFRPGQTLRLHFPGKSLVLLED